MSATAFVIHRCRCGAVETPPAPCCRRCGSKDAPREIEVVPARDALVLDEAAIERACVALAERQEYDWSELLAYEDGTVAEIRADVRAVAAALRNEGGTDAV